VEARAERALGWPSGWGLGRRPGQPGDFPQSARREVPRTFDRGSVQPGNVKKRRRQPAPRTASTKSHPLTLHPPRVLYIPLECWAMFGSL
jgi:hypothetical protein